MRSFGNEGYQLGDIRRRFIELAFVTERWLWIGPVPFRMVVKSIGLICSECCCSSSFGMVGLGGCCKYFWRA
jgi:hypothetical protein